jgi:isopentenyldiphosphate isomerase
MVEIMDLYDKNRQKLNETMVRGHQFKPERYHLVVHVCIFNSEGKMLIQKRRDNKERWPGRWDVSVGGCAIEGDQSHTAAERETCEELGLNINLSNHRPHLSVNFTHGFDDFYLLEKDVDISGLSFPTVEVDTVMWSSLDEIIKMIEDGTFIHYKQSFMTALFEMRNSYGTIYN